MKIGFLITARLKSTRLPLKLLLDLNGKTIFERVVERCKKVSEIENVILCSSVNSEDKPLVDLALKNNIYYYLGSEEDVLQRLSDAANFFNLDYIINITGENPLFSIHHANLMVSEIKKQKYDFVHISGLPIGCAVYGMRPEALKVVCKVKEEIDTEIWGPLINRPDIFNVKELKVHEYYRNPSLRITTDYFEDYLFMKEIFSHFKPEEVPDFLETMKLLKAKPEIMKINSEREQMKLSPDFISLINKFYSENTERVIELKKEYYND